MRLASQLARVFTPSPSFCWTIDSGDEMFRYSVDSVRGSVPCGALLYFLKGYQIFTAVEEVCRWKFGDGSRADRILDFASGWGRSTRFLCEIFDPSQIVVADAVDQAMVVQSRLFGVESILTSPSPSSFNPSSRFDLIVAASFFSHLPERTFSAWLRALSGALASDGALLFSTHGLELLGNPHERSRLVFVAASESSHLDPEEYGTCYVDADWVHRMVRQELGAEFAVKSWRRGLAGHQDLYLLYKGRRDGPEISRYPWGDVDRFEHETALELEGWCAGVEPSEKVERVELIAENVVVADCVPTTVGSSDTRHERSYGEWLGRWALSAPRAEIGPDDVLALWVTSRAGRRNLIGLGTLAMFETDASSSPTGVADPA